ncbi:MAG: hypothetical protein AAGD25_26205 [Cyanobacteria bacterium P01_F01_bin.150]
MANKTLKLTSILLTIVGTAIVASCQQNRDLRRSRNVAYLKDVLGGIVLEHRDTNGEVFASFEQSHTASGIVLDQRGDRFGRPLIYYKLGPESFKFHAFGPNGTNDNGGKDDIILIYEAGQWAERDNAPLPSDI